MIGAAAAIGPAQKRSPERVRGEVPLAGNPLREVKRGMPSIESILQHPMRRLAHRSRSPKWEFPE
jgi:hypothetical protein